MTSLNAKTEVLKQDGRGRVRVSAQRREALLDEFERSGVSGAKFARLAGIKYATFANWVLQRRSEERLVHFDDAHRLLGLFFNAMGINEHARVKVRNV